MFTYRINSRGSREPCGLKYYPGAVRGGRCRSRLARALWIEISAVLSNLNPLKSRLARALWIEMVFPRHTVPSVPRRGSREPCGLKSLWLRSSLRTLLSRLARALWIEIPDSSKNNFFKSSRFARALWIEIVISYKGLKVVLVEARESLVD